MARANLSRRWIEVEGPVSFSPACPVCRKRALFVDEGLYPGALRRVRSNEGAEEAVEMDKSVWGNHLPEGVVTNILAVLPLASLLRIRLVCKKWNALIESSNYQKIRSKYSTPAPICLVDHKRGLMAYDLASGPWTVLSDIYESSIYQHTGPFCGSQVVATAGGLILLTEDSHLHGLHVVNPSKTTWKSFHNRVPPLSPNYYIVGMVWNPMTKSYNILAAQRDHDRAAFHAVELYLYDSNDKSWRASGFIMPDKRVKNFRVQNVVLHEGRLHCLTVCEIPWQGPRFDVVRQDPGCQFWHSLPAVFPTIRPPPSRFRSSILLFDYRGQLMAAGVDTYLNVRLFLWQLDPIKGDWIKVRQLCEGPKESFSSLLQAEYHVQASGDYLSLCRYPVSPSSRENPTSVFVYNLWDGTQKLLPNLQQSWQLSPEPPRRRTSERAEQMPPPAGQEAKHVLFSWENRTFFFEPKPDAPV
ncbi:hypothetical protein MPTK1_7g06980 [Marchantia polymorpha subsp. ruderalis]|uniref:F-box domain-containing protein n=2 Tax=Marchantia polymorpha TaxID=3197 RepID=A0AAF6BWX9_MARPO|nr:hypothetical protein MARPO_0076s0096 [Marchantia polymorpha]BBN16513.1 hypothetical protein Mp_7g06980 [Marchantia polymorpha subsp. ruderalis]|eukprot:PTQ34865.1 hypothetical protein MARPO_0076s0096 [Marchantia polymorpha]